MYEHGAYLDEVDSDDRSHVEYMLTKLDEYCLSDGVLGDFLGAVIVGDLHGAVGHADETNVKYLTLYSKYCHNQLPTSKQDLAHPAVLVVHAVRHEHGWPTQGQVHRASHAFRLALSSAMRADVAADQLVGKT